MNFGPVGNKKQAGAGRYFPSQSTAPFDGNFWESAVSTSLSGGVQYDQVRSFVSCEVMIGPTPFIFGFAVLFLFLTLASLGLP